MGPKHPGQTDPYCKDKFGDLYANAMADPVANTPKWEAAMNDCFNNFQGQKVPGINQSGYENVLVLPPGDPYHRVNRIHGNYQRWATRSRYGDTHPNHPIANYQLDPNVNSQISAATALNGAKVKFSFGNNKTTTNATNPLLLASGISWIGASPDGFLIGYEDFQNAAEFTVNVDANSVVTFQRTSDSTFLAMDINDDESLRLQAGRPFKTRENMFYFSSNSAGQPMLNLNAITLTQFIQQFYTIVQVDKVRPMCVYNALRSWDKPCVGAAPQLRIFIVEPSPFYYRFVSKANDPNFRAKCCMGQAGDDRDICDVIKLSGETEPCDVFMNSYCNDHPTDPYCGCYSKNITAELQKLPPNLKQYESILSAQPRCWVPGCTTSYMPKPLRGTMQCDITICQQDTKIVGQDNVIEEYNGQLYCDNRPKPPPPPPPPTTTTPTPSTPTPSNPTQTTPTTPTTTTATTTGEITIPLGWVLLVLVILIAILVGILVAIKKKEKSEEKLGGQHPISIIRV